MNYVASPHFKLNSQPVCFLGSPSKRTNWGSNFLLKTPRWAHWSSPRTPEGKCMLVTWVWTRRRNSAVLTGVFGVRVCSVSLCLFEFVKVRAGCCASVSTDRPTPPNVSVIETHGPDLSLWISLLFPWWTKGAWRWWLWLSHFLYLFPNGDIHCCQLRQDAVEQILNVHPTAGWPCNTAWHQHMWLPSQSLFSIIMLWFPNRPQQSLQQDHRKEITHFH